MSDVFFVGDAMLLLAAEIALRLWLLVFGALAAGHYHAMANFLGRAPHPVKALVLPALTGGGVGMVVCAVIGATLHGVLFATVVAGLVLIVSMAAFASGAYVSAQFERAAAMKDQIEREGHVFVADLRSMADAAHLPDSAPAPLVDLPRPERATHRSSAP